MEKNQKVLKLILAIMMFFSGVFTNPVPTLAAALQGEQPVPSTQWTAWFRVNGRGCAVNGGCLTVNGRHRGRRRVVILLGVVDSEASANTIAGVPTSVALAEARAGARGGTTTTIQWGAWRTEYTTSTVTSNGGHAFARTSIQVRPRFR